jgi:hypothetical protein
MNKTRAVRLRQIHKGYRLEVWNPDNKQWELEETHTERPEGLLLKGWTYQIYDEPTSEWIRAPGSLIYPDDKEPRLS